MIIKSLHIRIPATIVKEEGGYSVYSEHKDSKGKRKRLGGPYATKAAAVKRLRQVEYYKHKGK